MKRKYLLEEIKDIVIDLKPGDIVFLNWDLAAWKTTLTKNIINNILKINNDVISPTYTYYNKYWENIYHFDLYRLNNYDEFFAIWWEEILDNNENISIIEWPDIIKKYIAPTYEINILKTENPLEREIEIIKK